MFDRRLGRVQSLMLYDLVTEGEWRQEDNRPGWPRAHSVLRSLEMRWYAHLEGDLFTAAVYRPTLKADLWYLHHGYVLQDPSRTPFIVLSRKT